MPQFHMVVEVMTFSSIWHNYLPLFPPFLLVQVSSLTDAFLSHCVLQGRGILPPILQSMSTVFFLGSRGPVSSVLFRPARSIDMRIDTQTERLSAKEKRAIRVMALILQGCVFHFS